MRSNTWRFQKRNDMRSVLWLAIAFVDRIWRNHDFIWTATCNIVTLATHIVEHDTFPLPCSLGNLMTPTHQQLQSGGPQTLHARCAPHYSHCIQRWEQYKETSSVPCLLYELVYSTCFNTCKAKGQQTQAQLGIRKQRLCMSICSWLHA